MNPEKETINKRLVIEVKKELHNHIKQRAVFRNMTIRHWVIIAIIEQIKREKQSE